MAVFAGLMLGSLIASLNLTLVAPALPTICDQRARRPTDLRHRPHAIADHALHEDVHESGMAVATSTTQLSRSIGAAIGFWARILTQGMAGAIGKYLPAAAVQRVQSS